MMNVLLSLNTDLGSSIAVRYANELTARSPMIVQYIHVVDPSRNSGTSGSGWVRHTYEKVLLESGEDEVRRFLEMEKAHGQHLKIHKIVIGDRTEKIIDELHQGQYHLFMEGVLPTFSQTDFHDLLTSRLYRLTPCPVLIVKNLVVPEKTALLLDGNTEMKQLVSSYSKVLNSLQFSLDLVFITFNTSGEVTVHEKNPAGDASLESIKKDLSSAGITPKAIHYITGPPLKIAGHLREYGLIVSSLNYNPRKNHPMIDLLGQTPSPLLICWR